MAVSKRLRYEILRRDNHACRYCGAADYSSGKTSCMPNAMLVADAEPAGGEN
ncbi:hypothetical protein [Streptomyces sp. NPDC047315]|uniref:hypothetical protein n=1 Tax=Streptomyces sp. NPDC047315 TaxID=3155142 RepID=UPI0033D7B1EB